MGHRQLKWHSNPVFGVLHWWPGGRIKASESKQCIDLGAKRFWGYLYISTYNSGKMKPGLHKYNRLLCTYNKKLLFCEH